MKNTDYTFAVARIRANENSLLSSSDIQSVISTGSYEEAVRRLNDKGYAINGTDYTTAIEKRTGDMWKLVYEILPDKTQFDSILIENDFQNLKVCLKAFFCGKKTDGLFFSPCVYDPAETEKNVIKRNNAALPLPLQHADRSAYRILSQTRFAQLADGVIDRAAMEWSIKLAEKADDPVMREIAQHKVAAADIRTVYRCVKADKDISFTERCVAECDVFDKKSLISSAYKGNDAFIAYLSSTELSGAGKALGESAAAFEKWCDDRLIGILRKAKGEIFGISPIAAYYFAVKTEAANVRIILSGKLSGASEDTVRQRVRELYV